MLARSVVEIVMKCSGAIGQSHFLPIWLLGVHLDLVQKCQRCHKSVAGKLRCGWFGSDLRLDPHTGVFLLFKNGT